ncbi:PREDICTED: ras-related and estrogen-regulated growth inhibitor isoform X1 [Polistes canadensis]|nr:PREDICTED: ras-related and estrogen-regulated growth inhibitor isoform X1 [Polistes canadensis]KAI4483671.1 hypothetical protein M0804_007931 [Polistes exclamans]
MGTCDIISKKEKTRDYYYCSRELNFSRGITENLLYYTREHKSYNGRKIFKIDNHGSYISYVTSARSMTSNAIRGIRRKKSSLCEVKVAVIGAPGVGKSALTVRFLTRRYIGEYDHQSENRYKHEVLVDGEPILFEILDSCPKSDDEMPSMETLQWADGLLLVYSITDRGSFNFVRKAKEALAVADPEAAMPLAMVGNKADMVHLRQVSAEEGEILAKDFECWFSEVSAAEQVVQVAESFHELCREVLAARRRNKQSLLDRMLGSKATRTYSRGKSDSALPKD